MPSPGHLLKRSAATEPVDVLFLVLPQTLLLDLAGPAEAFRLANQQRERQGLPPAFRLRYVSPEPRVTSSTGLGLGPLEPLPPLSGAQPTWVLLLGRPGTAPQVVDRQDAWLTARDWLGRQMPALLAAPPPGSPPSHRLITVCAGALLAADAGLLHRREVTTHHEMLDELAALAPTATVRANRLFVADGPVISSAGITAGIDLALHLIGQQLGEALAAAVAQVMVVFHRRGADDPALSPLLNSRRHLHPAVHAVQSAVMDSPHQPWTVASMAELAHVTPRHLSRLFRDHAGVSPRQHLEQVRHSLATQALACGLSVGQASEWAGFQSERQWRRAQQRRRAVDQPGPAGQAASKP